MVCCRGDPWVAHARPFLAIGDLPPDPIKWIGYGNGAVVAHACPLLGILLNRWQNHREGRATPHQTLYRDRTAVQLYRLLDDCQPQARAGNVFGIAGAAERLEQVGQIFWGDADTSVSHSQRQLRLIAAQAEVDGVVFRRIAHGVAQDIFDDLAQQSRVAIQLIIGGLDVADDILVRVCASELVNDSQNQHIKVEADGRHQRK